jgi:V-type H+-transporting ATPase subunit E
LRLLHCREEHLQDLFASARTQISRLADDEARYVQFLEGVIVQGLLQLLEPSATVYTRPKDAYIAERAIDGAKITYFEISGRQVEVDLDASLSDEL